MKSIIATICLMAPSGLLALRHHATYSAKPKLTTSRLFVSILFGTYVLLIVSLGADYIQGIESGLNYQSIKRFSTFFIYPGVGMGIILFPEIVAEFNDEFCNLVAINALGIYTVFGWLILLSSALGALYWWST